MTIDGLPAEAFGFYARLEADNSRRFWEASRADYQRFVREPMMALASELEDEFGPATVFRPQRDIRFSADKSPYKTYQGLFVERFPGTGFYAQVSADGLLASGGFHEHSPSQVDRYRAAVDAERSGTELTSIIARLERDGLSIGGEQLKTRPRGVPADHPRLGLLRYRSLTASRDWPADAVSGGAAISLIRSTWVQLIPLCDWMGEHVGGPEA